ncbi:hypothetical protein [Algihabitans sp.]|uniref:hypothetical protein n=1 Tax=Algihabitans sp. TaxID=2821514 RepID=UPI003BA980EC
MFEWLKKKRTAPEGAVEALAKNWLGPQALAVALAETIRDFVDDVNSGRVEYPAHKRRNDSVVGIWRDLRLEALSHMFNFGRSDPMLLADQRRQAELLRCLLDERPHLQMPQPRGEVVPDTLQAVWQVYLYLDQIGSEVADRETDRATLKLAKKNIFDDLTARAEQLRIGWEAFEGAIKNNNTELPETPETLLEELYQDVTAKTKSIALSAQFGPNYEAMVKMLEEEVRKRGGDVDKARASTQRVMEAKDPDEFAQS